MSSNENIKQESPPEGPPEDPEKLFKKWKFFYLSHGKAISEFTPELNILLRQYSIKKLYELTISYPEMKEKVFEFLKVIMHADNAAKVAKEFNVDKYCSYEEFLNFIEKAFESVEGEFKNKIKNYEFSNYLEIIAVYRLIIDITDLVDLWKEKDENILKFQTFCKYRVIKIYNMKINEKNREKTDVEKECEQLAEEVKREEIENKRKEEIEKKKKAEQEKIEQTKNKHNNNNLVRNRTMMSSVISPTMNRDINKNIPNHDDGNVKGNGLRKSSYDKKQNQTNEKNDFNQLKKITTISGVNNNMYMGPQLNQYPLTSNQNQQYNRNPMGMNKNFNNPYENLSLEFKQAQPQHPNINQNQYINPEYNLNNPKNFTGVTLHIKKPAPVPPKKVPVKEKDPLENELDKMLMNLQPSGKKLEKEKKDTPKKDIIPPKKEVKPPEKKEAKQIPKVDVKPQQKIEVKPQQKKEEIPIQPPPPQVKKTFTQLQTNLLQNYLYPGNKDLKFNFPIKFQDINYINLKMYIKSKLIPKITEDVKNKKIKEALAKSEMLLYYLTNILPKDSLNKK